MLTLENLILVLHQDGVKYPTSIAGCLIKNPENRFKCIKFDCITTTKISIRQIQTYRSYWFNRKN